MRKYILTLILGLFTFMSIGQTILYNDNCETSGYNWYGYPTSGLYSMYFGGTTSASDGPSNKPLYVSNSNSFGLYGVGGSSSGSEYERYQLPNITGLDPNKLYRFTFKLMAYAQNISGFSGSGLDAADSVTVRVSVNNGPYVIESIIKGWTNSYWSFNASGTINETANGVPNVYRKTSGSGGDQENTGFGFSTYNLLLTNITQIAIRIDMRANYGGSNYGEWWVIDDMELIEESGLPIELLSFEGSKEEDYNLLKWSTASEQNNDYFLLERSEDGVKWDNINITNSVENSNTKMDYSFRDFTFTNKLNYYRLTQVDLNGVSETFDVITVNNSQKMKKVLKITNTLGQEVSQDTKGILIITYTDGTSEKIMN